MDQLLLCFFHNGLATFYSQSRPEADKIWNPCFQFSRELKDPSSPVSRNIRYSDGLLRSFIPVIIISCYCNTMADSKLDASVPLAFLSDKWSGWGHSAFKELRWGSRWEIKCRPLWHVQRNGWQKEAGIEGHYCLWLGQHELVKQTMSYALCRKSTKISEVLESQKELVSSLTKGTGMRKVLGK